MKKQEDTDMLLVGKTHLDELLESVSEQYKEIYRAAYTAAENELIAAGETPDSFIGLKYCQQSAEKAITNRQLAELQSANQPQAEKHRTRSTAGVLFVRRALQLKQHAASSGQDEVFERMRMAMLTAAFRLLPESLLTEQLITDTDWIGDKADLAKNFLDISVGDLTDMFMRLADEDNSEEMFTELLKAGLKNARVSGKQRQATMEPATVTSTETPSTPVF